MDFIQLLAKMIKLLADFIKLSADFRAALIELTFELGSILRSFFNKINIHNVINTSTIENISNSHLLR